MAMEDAVAKNRLGALSGSQHPPAAESAKARVWDPFVRVFHWLLAAGFVVNYFELVREGKSAHQVVGYVMLGLVAARVVWGLVGPRHARFSDFVRAPREVADYLLRMVRHRDERHLGHNPAGGIMVLALLASVLLTGLTGWLGTTDWYFGSDFMEEAHEVAANALLALVILHVLGVVHASWRHRENLVLSMLTGRKRAPEAELQTHHAPADRRG